MDTYNGWTNYETWRVNLEWFDGMEFEQETNGESLRELVDSIIDDNGGDYDPTRWMIESTLDLVNWDEIARHINETLEL